MFERFLGTISKMNIGSIRCSWCTLCCATYSICLMFNSFTVELSDIFLCLGRTYTSIAPIELMFNFPLAYNPTPL